MNSHLGWSRWSCHQTCRFARCVLALAITLSWAPGVSADITGLRIGWCETYKLGRWTPIAVDMKLSQAVAGHIVISALDGEGIWCNTSTDELTLGAGSVTVTTYARLGINDQIHARFVPRDGGAALEFVRPVTERAITAWQQLVVSLGADVSITAAMQGLRREPDETAVGLHVANSSDLPDQWFGYDGIDALVVSTGELDWIRSMTAAQKSAIHQWVAQGGRVLVSVARHAPELAAPGEFLADWVPGPFLRHVLQRQTSSLEELADSAQRLDLLAQDSVGRFEGILTPVFDCRDGVVKEEGFGRDRAAWVIRRAHGLGMVTLLLADVDQSPFDRWSARARLLGRLVEELLPGKATSREDARRERGVLSQLGYFDLTGQLRAALDKYPGVRVVPFALVAGLAGIFVLLIGPVDYFVLRRLRIRMQLSWVTFSLITLTTCLGIALLARQWKGTSLVVNEVHLVDVAVETANLRGTSWTHIFTPRTDRLSIRLVPHAEKLRPGSSVNGVLLSWQGLPGSGFGGMSAPTRYGAFLDPYDVYQHGTASSPRMEIRELAMPQWSSRAFSGMWWGSVGASPDAGEVVGLRRRCVDRHSPQSA